MLRRSPIRRKTRLNRISRRGAERIKEYEAVKKAWLPLHPYCEIGPIIKAAGFNVRCKRVATHPHHVKGRHGKNLCDTTTWLASCSGGCHPLWVHQTNVKEAKELGLLQ